MSPKKILALAVLCGLMAACGSGGDDAQSASSDTTTASGTTTTTTTTSTASAATAADDGLIGWAAAHPSGAPTGGFAAIAGNEPVTCTATNMRVLRDCLYRAKKSNATNDDTRAGAPDWSTWEVHHGVTGGWRDYPVVIYLKGDVNANLNDSGKLLAQADYEAGTDALCGGVTKQPCQQRVTQAKLERGATPSTSTVRPPMTC